MATKKANRRSLALQLGGGTDYIRYVQFIHEPNGPDAPRINKIVSGADQRFGFLNRKIGESIQQFLRLSNESGRSNVIFKKSNQLMVPEERDVSVYFSSTTTNHFLYRVVFDFIGGEIGINFNLEDKEKTSEDLSHLVGVSHSNKQEIHGSDGLVDAIIYANLTVDAVLTILHDIALDIYFFHHYFDPFLGGINGDNPPDVKALRDFSSRKVQFVMENGFSIYGTPAAKFQNANNLKYVSFAAVCRKRLELDAFDFREYRKLWLSFFRIFNSEVTVMPISSARLDPLQLLSERLLLHILSLKRISGQLSRTRLFLELMAFLSRRQRNQAGSASDRNTIFFVITTVRPTESKKRNQIASLLRYPRWRKNQWRLLSNPPEKKLNSLLPYVQILKLNIP